MTPHKSMYGKLFAYFLSIIISVSYPWAEDDVDSVNLENDSTNLQSDSDLSQFLSPTEGSSFISNVTNQDVGQVSVSDQIYSLGLEDGFYDKLLNITNPIFFVTDNSSTYNYTNSLNTCSVINSSSSGINCILIITDDNKAGFMKHNMYISDAIENNSGIGDLTIMRADEYSNYNDTKADQDVPLDVITMLNGDYMFMLTPSFNKYFMVDQFLTDRNIRNINILALNQESVDIFNKYLSSFFINKNISITLLEEGTAEHDNFISKDLCNLNSNDDNNNVDIYMYFGPQLPNLFESAMSKCYNKFTPLSMSDDLLISIERSTPDISLANIISYFDSSSVANFLENFLSYENKLTDADLIPKELQTPISGDPLNNQAAIVEKTIDTRFSLPTISEQQVSNLAGKSVYNDPSLGNVFDTSPDLDKNANSRRLYVYGNSTIKTFGYRYILLASRYTRKQPIISVIDAIFRDYNTIKDNFLTPDMQKYEIRDLLLGTSSQNNYTYHVGVYFYPRNMLLSNIRKTDEQSDLIRLSSVNITRNKIPNSFGPPAPTYDQLLLIAQKSDNLERQRLEFSAVQILQRELSEIENSIDRLKNGEIITTETLPNSGMTDEQLNISNTPSPGSVGNILDNMNQEFDDNVDLNENTIDNLDENTVENIDENTVENIDENTIDNVDGSTIDNVDGNTVDNVDEGAINNNESTNLDDNITTDTVTNSNNENTNITDETNN